MLHFNLEKPVETLWFGEFISPDKGWKHLTRVLYDYELMILTEGTLFIADEREEYEIHAGEYLIMSPTRFQHGTRECSCRFYWLHFRAETENPTLKMPAHGRYADREAIASLAGALFRGEERDRRGCFSRYIATAILLELAAAKTAQEELGRNTIADKVKSFVLWHRFSDVRVGALAKELGYHEKYLSAAFRKEAGIPLKRYLTQERIKEAKRLLTDTDYTVAEVAYYLNFENPHNFSRFFKKECGITPLAFRTLSSPASV